MTERWLPVVGYEGIYQVSDQGRVSGIRRQGARGGLLTPNFSEGYARVSLSRDANARRVRVHTIVLEAFVGPRPRGKEALHHNDIRDDNRLDNLRWGTRPENSRDYVRNGKHHLASKTRCIANHEFTAENTGVGKRGDGTTFRVCKQCRRDYYRSRRPAA